MTKFRALKYQILKVIVDALRGRILIRVNLIGDNLTLLGKLSLRERRVKYHIANKFYGTCKVATHNRSVQRGILLCGVGIKLATKVFETTVHLVCFAARSTLEECVLHKVRNAILATMLIARACIDNQGAVRNTATHLTMNASYAIRECICLKLFHS